MTLQQGPYFQAADVYVHPARVDTFPTAVLQALACGTPVIATDVGGIPEQVKPLSGNLAQLPSLPTIGKATGVLVPPGDLPRMAEAMRALLRKPELREALGDNAAKDARERFDLRKQVDEMLGWYQQILGREEPGRRAPEAREGVSRVPTRLSAIGAHGR